MRCNWGADYADPETWTDPFVVKRDSETNAIVGNIYIIFQTTNNIN